MQPIIQEYIYRIQDFLNAGGPVMLPIIFVSFVMWILIINRILFLRRLFYKNMPRVKAAEYIKKNSMPEKKYRGANAFLVRDFLSRRSGDPYVDSFILDESVINIISYLDRHLSTIKVLAGVAPLLGLLGTVTGMITTFDVITVFGTGNAKAMAGGISEALITTQTGLLVSIPGLYMGGFLTKRAENLKHRVAATGLFLQRHIIC